MEPKMVLIAQDDIQNLITMMSRAEGYCRNAQSSRAVDLNAEPTATYPGASGYAGATLREAIQVLESAL